MHIVGVPGHHHVVPLVVVEWLVRVALHQRRPIAEIKDVVDIPAEKDIRARIMSVCVNYNYKERKKERKSHKGWEFSSVYSLI